jgi:hypothetical protein
MTASITLDADGLGIVRVDETQAGVVTTMTQSLGPPSDTTAGACHGRTEVEWHDLSLEFSSGVLAGYRYPRGGLAAVGTLNRPGGPSNPSLKTAAGVTLGMTLAEVRPHYAPNEFSEEQGGSISVPGAATGDRLFLLFGRNVPSTPLVEVKGGEPCRDI